MAQPASGNIEEAFAILLGEIETEVERITQEGQHAFAQRDFARAARLIDEGKAIETYVVRVKTLQREWLAIPRSPRMDGTQQRTSDSPDGPKRDLQAPSVSANQPPPPTPVQRAPSGREATRSGKPRAFRPRTGGARTPSLDMTSQDVFRIPILEILVQRGGSAPKVQVERELYKRLHHLFKPADFEGHESRKNQVRWKNSAQWCRANLVKEGLMIATSPRGIWEISEAGRSWLVSQQPAQAETVAPVSQEIETEFDLSIDVDDEVSSRSRRSHTNLSQGKRTHEHAFRVPILNAIVRRGGSAEVEDIMRDVYRDMTEIFNPYDLEATPNSRGEPRWSNNARFCRQVMVNKGWLKKNSPRGKWEITDAGRRWLAAEKSKRG